MQVRNGFEWMSGPLQWSFLRTKVDDRVVNVTLARAIDDKSRWHATTANGRHPARDLERYAPCLTGPMGGFGVTAGGWHAPWAACRRIQRAAGFLRRLHGVHHETDTACRQTRRGSHLNGPGGRVLNRQAAMYGNPWLRLPRRTLQMLWSMQRSGGYGLGAR